MAKIGTFRQCLGGYKAFIPDTFPPQNLVNWNNVFGQRLANANLAIGKLAGVERLVPDINFFITMYAAKESN